MIIPTKILVDNYFPTGITASGSLESTRESRDDIQLEEQCRQISEPVTPRQRVDVETTTTTLETSGDICEVNAEDASSEEVDILSISWNDDEDDEDVDVDDDQFSSPNSIEQWMESTEGQNPYNSESTAKDSHLSSVDTNGTTTISTVEDLTADDGKEGNGDSDATVETDVVKSVSGEFMTSEVLGNDDEATSTVESLVEHAPCTAAYDIEKEHGSCTAASDIGPGIDTISAVKISWEAPVIEELALKADENEISCAQIADVT